VGNNLFNRRLTLPYGVPSGPGSERASEPGPKGTP